MQEKNGKYIFGICKVNDKGQILISKEARTIFNIESGDNLVLLGDIKQGLALVKEDKFKPIINDILGETVK